MRKSKTYPFTSGPGASADAPVPNNDRRIAIFIQNTGATPGVVRFGGPPQGSGQDIAFAAGEKFNWDQAETCPQESVNLSSAAATTWVIMETVQ